MIFDLIYGTALLITLPWFIFKVCSGAKYRAGLKEKLGFLSMKKAPSGKAVWFHSVSVGETLAAAGLIDAFRKKHPEFKVIVSTTTYTGREIAEKKIDADIFVYYPFDFSLIVRRFLKILNPSAIILLELEVWPNMVRQAVRRGIPVGVVNGRLSAKSFKGFSTWNFMVRKTFSLLSFCGVQDETYLDRFIRTGASPEAARVTGNLKYDSLSEKPDQDKLNELVSLLDIRDGDTVIVAGSTHEGEEAILLDIYMSLKERFSGMRLVLVPRHPERYGGVKTLLKERGISFVCRTELTRSEPDVRDRVILIDTMGELSALYSLAAAAFVGGSFSGTGGHNVMEPVIFRKPVFTGPSTFNFDEDMQRLLENNGIIQVETPSEFETRLAELLENRKEADIIGENGYNTVIRYRGSIEQNLSMIENHIIKES